MSIATEAVKKSEVFEINGMNLWYGEHQALKDIHMKMNKHEVTAIIGPSGCGKSTFIKTLNLMIRMTPNVRMTGDMIYNGSNLLQQKVDVVELRKNIGMV
ncbi:ATP-binding cassette domain-containing protein, partial [Bacillus atrophaeus]